MSDSNFVRYVGDSAFSVTYHVSTGSNPGVLEFEPGQEREVTVDVYAWLCSGSFVGMFVPCSPKAKKPEEEKSEVAAAKKGK